MKSVFHLEFCFQRKNEGEYNLSAWASKERSQIFANDPNEFIYKVEAFVKMFVCCFYHIQYP